MPSAAKLAKKARYFNKLVDLCLNSSSALFVKVDHVTSKQMQDIRMDLRGKAVLLMGKNTMIRKALALSHEEHPEAGLDKIRAAVSGNIGFIFATNCTFDDIREILGNHRQPAVARAGQISLLDMSLPAGPTGLDPAQTSFFQALNIGTKIVKSQIELTNEFPILKAGERVTASGAVLLAKLGIKPFEYGMEIHQVFQDACVFDAAVLDIKDDVLIKKFLTGVANMAAFSREIGIPTAAGLPHAIGNAFSNIMALVADLDFDFPEASAALCSSPASACLEEVAGPAPKAKEAAAKPAKVVEEEEEEDMEFDLFG